MILGNHTGLTSFWIIFSIFLFGGLFGFVKGALIVFIFVSAVGAISQIDSFRDNAFVSTALNSSLYNYLLDVNPFNLITEGIL